jgi:hypothetical protein
VSPTPSGGATPAASFGDLADTWAGRAGLLIIHADGRAQALWPVGQVCGDAASGPCDASATELGGRATLALRWREDAMVVAEVADSSQESALPLGVAILRLRPDGVLELWPAAAAEAPRAYCNERLRQERPALVREWCSAATP